MKQTIKLLIPMVGLMFFSCKKEEPMPTEPVSSPTSNPNGQQEIVYEPNVYMAHILREWEIDSSTYWTGNNPNFSEPVIHTVSTGNAATYEFDYDIATDDRTVHYNSGSLVNGTAFGYHSFPTPGDPTHLRMSIHGGRDVYIRYLSNKRLEWVEYDPTGNGYTDSIRLYFYKE